MSFTALGYGGFHGFSMKGAGLAGLVMRPITGLLLCRCFRVGVLVCGGGWLRGGSLLAGDARWLRASLPQATRPLNTIGHGASPGMLHQPVLIGALVMAWRALR